MNIARFFEDNAVRLAVLPGLKRPLAYRTAALSLALLVVVGSLSLLNYLLPWLPNGFLVLLGLCLATLAVLWWFLRGARRFSRRGMARRQLGDLGPGDPEDERLPLQRMKQALAHARHIIARSPDMERSRNPLYRTPWLLFVGAPDSQPAALLGSASQASPFPPPTAEADDPEPVWRWWFFKSMIAIECHPRLVCAPQQRLERGLWYQALQLLANDRDLLPLNGMVICVGAQSLLQGAEEIREMAMRLRRLTDEALEHLQVQMPIYLLVSGLEQLPGCQAFCSALPAESLQRALGHRLPADARISAATSQSFDEIYTPIIERLQALRISALRGQADAHQRHAIWTFVEGLRNLGPGLQSLVTLMLEDNPFQRTPRWRGLYFTATATPGNGLPVGGAFIADLFTRLLPADQPLAAPSLRGRAAGMGVTGIGVLALVGLSVLFSAGLSGVRQDDGRLLQQTRLACQDQSSHGAAARIGWLARCGRTIEQLESANGNSGISLGLRHADADIERLKSKVVEEFSNLVLAPYDQLLASDLERGQAGLEHLLAISQRLRLLEQCRRRSDSCRTELSTNLTFDSRGRLFGPFVSGEQDSQVDRANAADLLTTYLGYLRWQDSAVLDAEASRLKTLLARTLSLYQPMPKDVRAWAATRRNDLRLTDFWLPADRVVGVDDEHLPKVSAAFTAPVWSEVLAPMLAGIQASTGDSSPPLASFRDAYLGDYLREWARLEARFFEGIELWRGRYGELTQRAAGHENPYRLLFREVERNLGVLPLRQPLAARWQQAWSEAHLDWIGAWRPLGRFLLGLPAGWIGDAQDFDAPPWWLAQRQAMPQLRAQDAQYAGAYLRLQQQDNDQDIYRITAELFGPERGNAEYSELLQRFEKPEQSHAKRFSPTDLATWQVMSGPARLLLFLTLRRTGEFIERRWRESVVSSLERLPTEQQMDALYGEHGKLAAFVRDWLTPFVSAGERAPVQVAGLALPLSPGYSAMIATEQRLQPLLNANTPFPAGSFQFTRASRFGTRDEGPLGTQLEVECKDRIYSASSKAESLADARTRVYWSPEQCPEARLRIALPQAEITEPADSASAPVSVPAPAAAAPRLIRIYSGAEGFVRLLEEFRSGARSLRIADFRGAYSAAQWQNLQPQLSGLSSVQVYLSIQPSDELKRFLGARNTPSQVPASILE